MVAQSKLGQVFSYQNWVHAVSGAAVSEYLPEGKSSNSNCGK